MRALIVLTPAESKRLIAKAVAKMDIVQSALKHGIVVLARGITNAYVLEDLLGGQFYWGGWGGGLIIPKGLCVTDKMLPEVVMEAGTVREDMSMMDALKVMDKDDVFIKGANALDIHGNAAILSAGLGGGTMGKVLGTIYAKGINLLIPVGLEKIIPSRISEIRRELGITRLDYSMGLFVGMIPLVGRTVTEVEALKILSNVEAIPIAAGGVDGAEGSIVLLIKGEDENMRQTLDLINKIKGERPTKVYPATCSECRDRYGHISSCGYKC
jgi:hypothetical protein